jgi:hypothetical protein
MADLFGRVTALSLYIAILDEATLNPRKVADWCGFFQSLAGQRPGEPRPAPLVLTPMN